MLYSCKFTQQIDNLIRIFGGLAIVPADKSNAEAVTQLDQKHLGITQ